MKRIATIAVALLAVGLLTAAVTGQFSTRGPWTVCIPPSCPTWNIIGAPDTAAGYGDAGVEDDLEIDDDVNIGDDLTVVDDMTADAATFTGKVTPKGMVDRASFSLTFDAGGATKGLDMIGLGGAAVTQSTGATNYAIVSAGTTAGNGQVLQYYILGAGQTLSPAMAATGLDLTGDQADNEGFEIVAGWPGTVGRVMYPGVDAAFKLCVTSIVTDVSDTDEFYFGFRRPEPYQANFADYNTYAVIGITAAAATATFHTLTEDDGGGATDTTLVATWADAATKTACVLVSASAAATYTVNGAADANAAAFSFDVGEGVIPVVARFLHAGAADCVPVLTVATLSYQ